MINNALNLFLYGLLFGSGPCLASCGALIISYAAATRNSAYSGLKAYLLFSFSRITAYLILSLVVFFLGKMAVESALVKYSGYIYTLGGSFIILIGVLTAVGRAFKFKPLNFLQREILQRDIKSILLMGLIIGLLPCAPLLAIFSYTGLMAKSWYQSLLYAFSFAFGTIISPLLLLTMLAGSLPRLFVDKNVLYYRIFNSICGLIIIILGVQLFIRGL